MATTCHTQPSHRGPWLHHLPVGPARRTTLPLCSDPIQDWYHDVFPEDLELRDPDSKLESQWALLKLDRGRQLVIGSLYRPPRRTVAALHHNFADLETQLQRVLIDPPGVPLVLCGDLNCDWLKDHSDPARRRFVEFLSDHSLHQLVASSTFTTGSLLDVCVVNNRDIVRSLSVFHCDFSPHSLISVRLNVPKPRVKPIVITSRDLKHIDLAAFNFDLGCVNWGGGGGFYCADHV